ncbi:MAG TPA: hypothetical protein VGD77_02030 [Gemmatimonadaceae bacterium]
MLLVLTSAALLLAPPAAAAPSPAPPPQQPSINLSLTTASSAGGPQAPGQSFTMSVNYAWSNAPGGQHRLLVTFSIPGPLELVNSSAPLGGGGLRVFERSFTTVAGGPFNQSSNRSGSGSFTITLRFRNGISQGTQACVAPAIRDGNMPGPTSQQCFTAGGSGSGPGGGSGGSGGGSNGSAVSHWGISHDLADGTGIAAATAIFRVALVNGTPTAPGEPGLVAPTINYSVINPAKIVAVSQSPSPGSGLPAGWTHSGTLPSPVVSITGPATLAPGAALPVLYVHVSLAGVPLGGTNEGVASVAYRLSSNPQSSPLVIGNTKAIRVVAVLK